MATLSELVTTIATTEGIDRERVNAIARAAREHGLIRTSGRGTSAAQMSEADAANLLIATNTADTARAVPAAVQEYRALQAKRGSSQFGNELEELLSAARREVLADYVVKMITFLGERDHLLSRRRFQNEDYRFEIAFEKPLPLIAVGVSVAEMRHPKHKDFVEFRERRRSATDSNGDRSERITITERTILAVASVLRT